MTPDDPRLEIPKIIGWPQGLKWPPDADQLLTPAASRVLQTFLWPLTMDELLTLSPAESVKKAKEERRKPTTDKLFAWFGERLIGAYRESKTLPDPDTRRRRCREAWEEGWNDIQKALAEAHTMKQRDDLENLAKANKVQKKRLKTLAGRVRTEVGEVWSIIPRRQKTVNNITKILCNPKKIKNRPITPNMERWKYRWSYKNKIITTPFWTLYPYVNDAVKVQRSASP